MGTELHRPTNGERVDGFTQLILIRHAETASNAERRLMGQQDSPVTPYGYAQIRAVAERMSHVETAAVHTSDLGRCITTARSIAHGSDVRWIPDPRLRERHAGTFQGQLRARIEKSHPHLFKEWLTCPDAAFPSGETARQVAKRAVPCLQEIAEEHLGQTVVVVTHGGLLRTLLWSLCGMPFATAQRAHTENTGCSVLFYRESEWSLHSWNDACHVPSRWER